MALSNFDTLPCASQLGHSTQHKKSKPCFALPSPIKYSMVFVKEAEGNWYGNRDTVLEMTRKAAYQSPQLKCRKTKSMFILPYKKHTDFTSPYPLQNVLM